MPLSKAELIKLSKNVEEAEKAMVDVVADIRSAKRAGIDVADEEKELNILRKSIRGIKSVYVGV